MVEALEGIAKKSDIGVSESRKYSDKGSVKPKTYSTFTEMYLERPIGVDSMEATPTVCTWRGIPTVDDF